MRNHKLSPAQWRHHMMAKLFSINTACFDWLTLLHHSTSTILEARLLQFTHPMTNSHVVKRSIQMQGLLARHCQTDCSYSCQPS